MCFIRNICNKNTFFVAWIYVMVNSTRCIFRNPHKIVSGLTMNLNTLVNVNSMLSLSFSPILVLYCSQNSSEHRGVNMKIYMSMLVLGWSTCCKAGGGVNFDVMKLLTFDICINIGMALLFKQAGFHIASGNKDLSDMLNNNKESDNTAVYHSWINSILEAILHELDEKFEVLVYLSLLSFSLSCILEVAEEDRESTNFWIICMGVLTLILFLGLGVSFVMMFTRLSRKQKGPSEHEMNELSRRASRAAEDINVNFKREVV